MRRPGGLASSALGVLSLLLLRASGAQAAPHLQAVGETSLGYTDNAQASSDQASASRTKSAFWMLSPGLVLAIETPRVLQRLSYRYEYDLYFNNAASSSSANRLDYRGFFELSRRVTLVLGGTATEFDRFSTVAFSAPGSGVVGALPAGTGRYLTAAADQAFGFDVGEGFRAWQNGSVALQTPLFDTEAPETKGVAARVGAERSFLADSVGLEARGDYTVVTGSVTSDGSALPVQRQLTGAGVALWRHDWARSWTSSVEAGGLRLERLNTHRGLWTPIGSAVMSYATERGDAQLQYAHTISTNALLGQTLLVDELRLRGTLPLTSEGELALASSCGYQRGRLLDENARLATKVKVLLVDVSLGWQATQLVELGVRYEHIRQKSGADEPPLPLSFVQNNVLVGASIKFPAERNMPRPYRAPRRVDRTDELRDGIRPAADGVRGPGNGAR